MDVVVIAVIAMIVVGAVAWPLLRGGPASDPHLDPDPAVLEATDAKSAGAIGSPELEREVLQYRDALRAGTVCARCAYANPAGSHFCAQCGARIVASGGSSNPASTESSNAASTGSSNAASTGSSSAT